MLEVKTAKEKREEFLREDTSERAKVNAWLDRINETDEACRAEVLDQCAKDPEAVHIMLPEARRNFDSRPRPPAAR